MQSAVYIWKKLLAMKGVYIFYVYKYILCTNICTYGNIDAKKPLEKYLFNNRKKQLYCLADP